MLGLLTMAACEGRDAPTAPTAGDRLSAPQPRPQPEPSATPPPDCRALSCTIAGTVEAYGTRTYRAELTTTGRVYLRVRTSGPSHTITLGTYFCRGGTGSCTDGLEDVGMTPVVDMAVNRLNVGDEIMVDVRSFHSAPASFVLDFELDPGTAPPPCVPTLRAPMPGAELDNGRTDQRDGIIWEFAWNECPGATDYDVEVGRGGVRTLIAAGVAGASFRYISCAGHVPDANRLGWSWRVRAHAGARYGTWSEERPFVVERADSDPIARCP